MANQKMFRVLIVEDVPADIQKATDIFHKLSLEVQSQVTIAAARNLLEDVSSGEHPAPHLIVLDLGFPFESGF